MRNSARIKFIAVLLPLLLLYCVKSQLASVAYQWRHSEAKEGWVSTLQTDVTVINDHHFSVQGGAVVVKAGTNNLFISTPTTNGRLLCRLAPGVQALFESRKGKIVIVNLSNRCCGAVLLYMPDGRTAKLIKPLEQSIVIGTLEQTWQLSAKVALEQFDLQNALDETAIAKITSIGQAPSH